MEQLFHCAIVIAVIFSLLKEREHPKDKETRVIMDDPLAERQPNQNDEAAIQNPEAINQNPVEIQNPEAVINRNPEAMNQPNPNPPPIQTNFNPAQGPNQVSFSQSNPLNVSQLSNQSTKKSIASRKSAASSVVALLGIATLGYLSNMSTSFILSTSPAGGLIALFATALALPGAKGTHNLLNTTFIISLYYIIS